MILYESEFLQINFEEENNCFVQFWKKSPKCYSKLKDEFLEFIELYKKYCPEKTLWLQQNFQLPINLETHRWIEENVNIPGVNYGNEKVAFVVGKDVLVHLSVMNYFEEDNSVIHPLHFATEKEARQWLNGQKDNCKNSTSIKILFEGVDAEGNSIIKIKRPSKDITSTLLSIGHVIDENNFIKSNISKYSRLTKREKEIMVIFSKGFRQQEVADQLFISIETLRTHWKNIKKKLDIKSIADVSKYVNAFDMK
ncbi:response regulator transcription factor [Gramella sp. MT6]|uniref:response regulator transcription factor n=1 Tax=Gramella sp. MT6 TaxID=2705471 RepID=UPI001C5F7A9C|nr:LuxR C-terminal-related transcriptional regulator [Gramella sp. MT6]QYA25235.1 response regulator transcription factor [Gramella sp. MT6]